MLKKKKKRMFDWPKDCYENSLHMFSSGNTDESEKGIAASE